MDLHAFFIVKKHKSDCAKLVDALKTAGFQWGTIISLADDVNAKDAASVEQWNSDVLSYLMDGYWFWLFKVNERDDVLIDDYP